MRIGLLGDVAVFGNDDIVVPLSRQLRRLVAVLALAGPAGVGTDRLAECVIGSATDGSALRMAVSRLRRHLGDMIEKTAQGYRMTFAGQSSDDLYDVRTFERLVDLADQMVVPIATLRCEKRWHCGEVRLSPNLQVKGGPSLMPFDLRNAGFKRSKNWVGCRSNSACLPERSWSWRNSSPSTRFGNRRSNS